MTLEKLVESTDDIAILARYNHDDVKDIYIRIYINNQPKYYMVSVSKKLGEKITEVALSIICERAGLYSMLGFELVEINFKTKDFESYIKKLLEQV